MRWTPWSFLGRWRWLVPRWEHSPRMRNEGSGDESSLPNSFGWEFILNTLNALNTFLRGSTHFTFHGGALISYIYISCFHDDVIKWKHVPRHWLLCGEFSGDCGEFTGHRWIPLTQTSDAELDVFFDLRLHKRLSKLSRRWWFETPSLSLWRHCNVVPNSDPVIREPWDLSAFNASLLPNSELMKRVKLGGFRALWKERPQIWRTGLSWLPFLEINYMLHSAAV